MRRSGPPVSQRALARPSGRHPSWRSRAALAGTPWPGPAWPARSASSGRTGRRDRRPRRRTAGPGQTAGPRRFGRSQRAACSVAPSDPEPTPAPVPLAELVGMTRAGRPWSTSGCQLRRASPPRLGPGQEEVASGYVATARSVPGLWRAGRPKNPERSAERRAAADRTSRALTEPAGAEAQWAAGPARLRGALGPHWAHGRGTRCSQRRCGSSPASGFLDDRPKSHLTEEPDQGG
jgi:hypothetical protein